MLNVFTLARYYMDADFVANSMTESSISITACSYQQF